MTTSLLFDKLSLGKGWWKGCHKVNVISNPVDLHKLDIKVTANISQISMHAYPPC